MITFSINRPNPYQRPPAQEPQQHRHIREIIRNRTPQAVGAVISPDKLLVVEPPKDEEKKGILPWEPLGKGKHQYNEWMNKEVYSRFKLGQLVTLRQVAHILNKAPIQWFRLTEFQEVHYMADLDRQHMEPRAVGITSRQREGNFPVFYAPSALRHLWPDELSAIKVQEQEEKNDLLRNQSKTDTERREDVSSSSPSVDGEGRSEEGNI